MEPLDRNTAIGILSIIGYLILFIFGLFLYYLIVFKNHYKEYPRLKEYPEILSVAVLYGLIYGSSSLMLIGGLITIIYRCVISL